MMTMGNGMIGANAPTVIIAASQEHSVLDAKIQASSMNQLMSGVCGSHDCERQHKMCESKWQ
jgi:hypothetical protein